MNVSVYRAESENGSSYFIKLKLGHNHDVGVTLLTLLHDTGIQQIIPSIKSIHKKLSVHLDDFTLIVFPFIEGRDGFSHTLTDNQWIILGKVLRQVHAFDVPPSMQTASDEKPIHPNGAKQFGRSMFIWKGILTVMNQRYNYCRLSATA